MEQVRLPAGYLLPQGTTMADVRRFDRELLASEGLEVRELDDEDAGEEDRAEEG